MIKKPVKLEQATFRIIPLNSGDDITFGEEFPVKEDFPKHIVEKSISDNEPIFFSDPRSEILPAQDNHPSNLNFRSLPDVYDHNEVFPNDAQENADIYDGLDNTDDDHIGEFYFHENTYVNADPLKNKNQVANEYEQEIIGHGENYQTSHTQPQFNVLVIPKNKDSFLPLANTLAENYVFEPNQHKQQYVPTLSTKVDPIKQENLISFSQPYTYSPDEHIPLPPPNRYKPQSRENRPTETQKNFISRVDSNKEDQISSPTYSYAYSVNGGSNGPIFAKHEDSDGHATKVSISMAKLLITIAEYIL